MLKVLEKSKAHDFDCATSWEKVPPEKLDDCIICFSVCLVGKLQGVQSVSRHEIHPVCWSVKSLPGLSLRQVFALKNLLLKNRLQMTGAVFWHYIWDA